MIDKIGTLQFRARIKVTVMINAAGYDHVTVITSTNVQTQVYGTVLLFEATNLDPATAVVFLPNTNELGMLMAGQAGDLTLGVPNLLATGVVVEVSPTVPV